MLSLDEQRKSIGYSVMFLRSEVSDLKKSIRLCKDEDVKRILERRKCELEPDLELFERLGNHI